MHTIHCRWHRRTTTAALEEAMAVVVRLGMVMQIEGMVAVPRRIKSNGKWKEEALGQADLK